MGKYNEKRKDSQQNRIIPITLLSRQGTSMTEVFSKAESSDARQEVWKVRKVSPAAVSDGLIYE